MSSEILDKIEELQKGLETKVESLRSSFKERVDKLLGKERGKLQSKLEDAEEDLQMAKETETEAQGEVTAAESALEEAQTELERARNELAEATTERETLENTIVETQAQLQGLQAIDGSIGGTPSEPESDASADEGKTQSTPSRKKVQKNVAATAAKGGKSRDKKCRGCGNDFHDSSKRNTRSYCNDECKKKGPSGTKKTAEKKPWSPPKITQEGKISKIAGGHGNLKRSHADFACIVLAVEDLDGKLKYPGGLSMDELVEEVKKIGDTFKSEDPKKQKNALSIGLSNDKRGFIKKGKGRSSKRFITAKGRKFVKKELKTFADLEYVRKNVFTPSAATAVDEGEQTLRFSLKDHACVALMDQSDGLSIDSLLEKVEGQGFRFRTDDLSQKRRNLISALSPSRDKAGLILNKKGIRSLSKAGKTYAEKIAGSFKGAGTSDAGKGSSEPVGVDTSKILKELGMRDAACVIMYLDHHCEETGLLGVTTDDILDEMLQYGFKFSLDDRGKQKRKLSGALSPSNGDKQGYTKFDKTTGLRSLTPNGVEHTKVLLSKYQGEGTPGADEGEGEKATVPARSGKASDLPEEDLCRAAVKINGTFSSQQLGESFKAVLKGKSKAYMNQRVTALVKAGLFRKVSRGVFEITAKGRKLIGVEEKSIGQAQAEAKDLSIPFNLLAKLLYKNGGSMHINQITGEFPNISALAADLGRFHDSGWLIGDGSGVHVLTEKGMREAGIDGDAPELPAHMRDTEPAAPPATPAAGSRKKRTKKKAASGGKQKKGLSNIKLGVLSFPDPDAQLTKEEMIKGIEKLGGKVKKEGAAFSVMLTQRFNPDFSRLSAADKKAGKGERLIEPVGDKKHSKLTPLGKKFHVLQNRSDGDQVTAPADTDADSGTSKKLDLSSLEFIDRLVAIAANIAAEEDGVLIFDDQEMLEQLQAQGFLKKSGNPLESFHRVIDSHKEKGYFKTVGLNKTEFTVTGQNRYAELLAA